MRQAQWFLDTVHAISAQAISKGAGVKVCVIDTGVDATHPDLKGAVLPGKGFGSDAPSADGRVDVEGHGTAMAGLIAARGGGANNALGVAPAALILPTSVGSGARGVFGEQVRWCVDNGAKVINLSGGALNSDVVGQGDKDAFGYAVTHDVVVVVSMGNTGQTGLPNPLAKLPGVIGVSGTDQSNALWSSSQYGSGTALAAPAITVTTYPKTRFSSGFGQGGGTSDSAAIVSGVAALVRAKFPNMDANNVVNRLIKSASDLGAPGRDDKFGYGLVNAEKALTMNIAEVKENPLGTPGATSASPSSGPSAKNIFSTARGGANPLAAVVWLVIIGGAVAWFVMRRRKRKALDSVAGHDSHGMPPMPVAGPTVTPPSNVVMPQAPVQPQQPTPPGPPQGPTPPPPPAS